MPLKIQSAAECEFDVMTLGECMIRLTPPGHQRIELTSVFEAYAGGGEYNVAYALSRYGLRAGWISRLVDNPMGHFIRNHANASGMDTSEVVWVPYDGVAVADAVKAIAAQGFERVIAICLAPQNSRTSVGLYRRASWCRPSSVRLGFRR